MTLTFEQYGQLATRMRALAANNAESNEVRRAARDIVAVLEHTKEEVVSRLVVIAEDTGRADAARVRAMEVLLSIL